MVAQSLGFGLSDAGIKRFSNSSGPLGDLGKDYIGSGFADVINFGATMSAFAAALGAGLLIAMFVPDLARRIGEGLAREEGMKPAGSGD